MAGSRRKSPASVTPVTTIETDRNLAVCCSVIPLFQTSHGPTNGMNAAPQLARLSKERISSIMPGACGPGAVRTRSSSAAFDRGIDSWRIARDGVLGAVSG